MHFLLRFVRLEMLVNKKEVKTGLDTPDRQNWGPMQTMVQGDLVSDCFLFDDGHVEVVCRFEVDTTETCPLND